MTIFRKTSTHLRSLTCAALLLATAPAMAQNLNLPENIVYSPDGNIYVVNRGSSTIASFQTIGAGGRFLGSFATAKTGFRLAVDGGKNLFMAEFGGKNVDVYTPAGVLLKTVANASGFGLAVDAYDDLISTSTDAFVFNEAGLKAHAYKVDKQGLMYAGGSAVISGQKLYIVTGPGSGASTVATYNVGNFLTGDPTEITPFTNSAVSGPTQAAVDSSGNVYIVGLSGNLVKYSSTGAVQFSLNGLANPTGVALDPIGNIYVSENTANDIKVFNPSGTLIGVLH